jgi:aspartate aminotransferase, cytoplasmic
MNASIFKLTAAFKADSFPHKVNLGVGAYRDNDSRPWILPVVKKVVTPLPIRVLLRHYKATDLLFSDPTTDHEYLSIIGLPEFTSAAAKLILGSDSNSIKEGRVARFVPILSSNVFVA